MCDMVVFIPFRGSQNPPYAPTRTGRLLGLTPAFPLEDHLRLQSPRVKKPYNALSRLKAALKRQGACKLTEPATSTLLRKLDSHRASASICHFPVLLRHV